MIVIKDVSPSATGAISIPSTLGGCPVTSIGDSAFPDFDTLQVVYVALGDVERVKVLYDLDPNVQFIEKHAAESADR